MNILSAITIILMSLATELIAGSQEFTVNSDVLTNLKFDAPENLVDKKYLGLQDQTNFRLSQIEAKYLIIEIFSMYCPICQRGATVMNQLYDLMQQVPGFRNNAKIIGLGAGNTPYEVNVFKKKFNVSFPLVADDNFVVQKALSHDIRTPTFLVGKLSGNGKLKIVFTKVGEIKDAGEFLVALMTTLNPR